MTIEEMNNRKKELGYSYEQIASLSGIPLSTVRKVLGGKTQMPRYKTVQALSACLSPDKAVSSGKDAGNSADRKAEGLAYSYPKPAGAGMVAETAAAYGAAVVPAGQAAAKGMPQQKKQGEYTLEDYLALPEERRVELIDGVIYDMSAPTGFHQLIAGQIHAMILAYIRSKKGKCLPFISPIDVQLDCDNRTIVQPDVIILCDTGKYTPARIVGAPDFVVEVFSPSTRSKDIFIKLNKYRSAGVREYWMVDPKKKKVYIYRFEHNDDYDVYSFRDRIPVGIYDGDLTIDFSEIDDFVSPWMGDGNEA